MCSGTRGGTGGLLAWRGLCGLYFHSKALAYRQLRTKMSALRATLLFAAAVLCTAVQKPTVLVIGAGFSGLKAARDLSDAGATVTVLEGRDRIGGRVWSDRSLGVACDMGASWIHGPVPFEPTWSTSPPGGCVACVRKRGTEAPSRRPADRSLGEPPSCNTPNTPPRP